MMGLKGPIIFVFGPIRKVKIGINTFMNVGRTSQEALNVQSGSINVKIRAKFN